MVFLKMFKRITFLAFGICLFLVVALIRRNMETGDDENYIAYLDYIDSLRSYNGLINFIYGERLFYNFYFFLSLYFKDVIIALSIISGIGWYLIYQVSLRRNSIFFLLLHPLVLDMYTSQFRSAFALTLLVLFLNHSLFLRLIATCMSFMHLGVIPLALLATFFRKRLKYVLVILPILLVVVWVYFGANIEVRYAANNSGMLFVLLWIITLITYFILKANTSYNLNEILFVITCFLFFFLTSVGFQASRYLAMGMVFLGSVPNIQYKNIMVFRKFLGVNVIVSWAYWLSNV